MARYRIGEDPDTPTLTSSDDFFIFIVVFGLFLGIGFTYIGLRTKQIWLTIWGGGLTIASVVYLGYILFY